MSRILFHSIAALALGGCMLENMDHGAMDSAIADTRAEVQRHGAECQGAADSDAATKELKRHQDAMALLFGRMDNAIGDMEGQHHCGGGTSAISQDVAALKARLQAHGGQMAEARGVEAIHEQCASYGVEMTGLCKAVQDRVDDVICM